MATGRLDTAVWLPCSVSSTTCAATRRLGKAQGALTSLRRSICCQHSVVARACTARTASRQRKAHLRAAMDAGMAGKEWVPQQD